MEALQTQIHCSQGWLLSLALWCVSFVINNVPTGGVALYSTLRALFWGAVRRCAYSSIHRKNLAQYSPKLARNTSLHPIHTDVFAVDRFSKETFDRRIHAAAR